MNTAFSSVANEMFKQESRGLCWNIINIGLFNFRQVKRDPDVHDPRWYVVCSSAVPPRVGNHTRRWFRGSRKGQQGIVVLAKIYIFR